VGLASPAVRGEEDRELTFEVRDGAMGSGMVMGLETMMGALPTASRLKAGSATGLARRRGIEGGSRGTEGGGVNGVASREAVAQRAGNMGSLMAQTKISL
jgi:hypothetical protein